MNVKIISLSIFAVAALVVGLIINNNLKNKAYSVECNSKTQDCTYVISNGFGKPTFVKNFKYSDVMQCNAEPNTKKNVDNKDIVYSYNCYIYLNYGNDLISFENNDVKNFVEVCNSIHDKVDFKYIFPVLKK